MWVKWEPPYRKKENTNLNPLQTTEIQARILLDDFMPGHVSRLTFRTNLLYSRSLGVSWASLFSNHTNIAKNCIKHILAYSIGSVMFTPPYNLYIRFLYINILVLIVINS